MRSFRRLSVSLILLAATAVAQDTGALRGTVTDPTGARIASSHVELVSPDTGLVRAATADAQGGFAFDLVRPGAYELRVTAAGMAELRREVRLEVGAQLNFSLQMQIGPAKESVTVAADAPAVEIQPGGSTEVIDERAIRELPLNGRRFTDLTLLDSRAVPDPRSLTSSGVGDLAFGGIRGFQSSFLVDGADNNNAFFSQARGRYRAPYQFSNEVIQEFRVSSNTTGADLGRSGGAVVNVVTKSGSNHTHGSLFYYLRDGRLSATNPFVRKRYPDRQQQFGGSLGGPIKRDKLFYFAGFDQHVFHIPTVVQFANGSSQIVPSNAGAPTVPPDYEFNDKQLVFDTAARLSSLAGQYRSRLVGNTGFGKLDWTISPHHVLTLSLNTSRFYGQNNVFFDPASPLTNFGITDNGEEDVATESALVSLTSVLRGWNSHLRLQFSRDLQSSESNSEDVATRIQDIISGFGRASILPRKTNERRYQFAETISRSDRMHSLKFGGDVMLTHIDNFFPAQFGGEYIFDNVNVNPFTFAPQTFGLKLTPLRAYAHQVPRYYFQDFGNAVSKPDSNDYSLFVQDTIRLGDHLALSPGLRWEYQSFRSDRLAPNPLWPGSGKVPSDVNNFAPRLGFAASTGGDRPFTLRGGYGLFFTRIPQIYNSAVETDNGLTQSEIFLDNSVAAQRAVMPSYPNPLVGCASHALTCAVPPGLAAFASTEISAFAQNYQTPFVHQATLSVEREVAKRTALSASYLYVGGRHLIRARDANLPDPVEETYPVFSGEDQFGNPIGQVGTYTIDSFSQWIMTKTLACPFPPCLSDVQRPISNVGQIRVFDSAASSSYNGFTFSAKRRMTDGIYFRLSYTFAKAIDNGQDALITGHSLAVQNSADPNSERALSTTDQRQRLVFAFSANPHPFHREHPLLGRMFNSWGFSTILSAGSGRPLTGTITGDPNRDTNRDNDRLPGASRNSFTGPDYVSGDLRLTRRFEFTDRLRLEASAEAFNVSNRNNKRVSISEAGFANQLGSFTPFNSPQVKTVPGYFIQNATTIVPNNAYAPRQVQLSLRLKF
jgi:hypothetical protein